MAASLPPDDRVVMVSGANRGIGLAIARHLSALGYRLSLGARDQAMLAEVTAGLPPDRVLRHRFDAMVPADTDAWITATLARFGRLDALVNNAGMAPRVRADVTEMTEASFEELIRINLQGPFFLTQAVANHWLAKGYAPALEGGFKVLFITSISADTASINRGEYCISKAGLAMASQLWAVRLAADDVQVLELRPGIMATDMTAGVKGKYDALLAEGLVPQRRWGTPEDVGKAVRAVLSGAFPFTTGDVIHLDGGFHIRRL